MSPCAVCGSSAPTAGSLGRAPVCGRCWNEFDERRRKSKAVEGMEAALVAMDQTLEQDLRAIELRAQIAKLTEERDYWRKRYSGE